MAKSLNDVFCLKKKLTERGMKLLGAVQLTNELCAESEVHFAGKYAIVVGNAGSDMWEAFMKSEEFLDGEDDPMNRWVRRVISGMVEALGCHVRYPSDEPYWPFQRIACEATQAHNSPIGLLVHPKYGLWHAYRAIIILNQDNEMYGVVQELIASVQNMDHPCESCIDKPCLSSCPVVAFSGSELDTETCFKHLDSPKSPDCMSIGCGARNACPYGLPYKYAEAQIKFHMKSYRGPQ